MQICNQRPAYNDGRRAFPTCGNTCARALEATKRSTPSARSNSTQVSSAARGTPTSNSPRVSTPFWQPGLMSHEPTGPPPGYTARAPLCVVRNSQIASSAFISNLSINAGLQRETGLQRRSSGFPYLRKHLRSGFRNYEKIDAFRRKQRPFLQLRSIQWFPPFYHKPLSNEADGDKDV